MKALKAALLIAAVAWPEATQAEVVGTNQDGFSLDPATHYPRMGRWIGAGVVGPFMAGLVPKLAADRAEDAARGTELVVRVSDYARIPADMLGTAVQLARSVLGRAGVETHWRAGTTTALDAPPRDREAGRGSELTIEIFGRGQSRALAPSPEVLGFALLPTREGEDPYGVVFVEKATGLARKAGVPLPLVLGHAMAHEIGHLLLGTHDHSTTGLMRAQWSSQELQRAAWGQLRFSDDESARLRRAVTGHFVEEGPPALLTAPADFAR